MANDDPRLLTLFINPYPPYLFGVAIALLQRYMVDGEGELCVFKSDSTLHWHEGGLPPDSMIGALI
jgi:hypothetical protein